MDPVKGSPAYTFFTISFQVDPKVDEKRLGFEPTTQGWYATTTQPSPPQFKNINRVFFNFKIEDNYVLHRTILSVVIFPIQ